MTRAACRSSLGLFANTEQRADFARLVLPALGLEGARIAVMRYCPDCTAHWARLADGREFVGFFDGPVARFAWVGDALQDVARSTAP